jgi:hypothetical protein
MSGDALYHAIQNILSSYLLFKNINIKIYKAIIVSLLLYGHETWPLTTWEEHRLRVLKTGH